MTENGYDTYADLARAAGKDLSGSTIGRWASGENRPTLVGLRAVAPHLGVRLGDLLIKADLATAAELGTTGSPPPPRAPLPPELQRVVSLLLSPKYSQPAKASLLNAVARAIELWQEISEIPKEPQMRRRSAKS